MGLVHTFVAPGGSPTRTLPETTGNPITRQRLGGYKDRASMRGGYQSASGQISPAEFAAYPAVYVEGAKWTVHDDLSGEDLFIGKLKTPAPKADLVEVAADGLAIVADQSVERVLFASQAVDLWAPGDADPFNFSGATWMMGEVKGNSLVWQVKRFVTFKRNDANQPAEWVAAPLVFWAPKTDLRWIKFDIDRHGPAPSNYRLELVGTATGPTGALSVINSWSLAAGGPASVDYAIAAGYDLIGLRVVRETEVKRAPHNRFRLRNVIVGAIAQASPYELDTAFTTLFSMMAMSTSTVQASSLDILPYDAARVSLAKVADDLSVLGSWYWRLWGSGAGATVGEAGPIGNKSYTVSLTHTPLPTLPVRRYNVVQYDYAYGGGYTSQDVVRANPDPWPTEDHVYVLQLEQPPVKVLAERFAQVIANHLSKQWYAGSGTLFKVMDGAVEKAGNVVRPGDKLVLTNQGGISVIVDEMSHSEDGLLTQVEFADSNGLVDQWIAQRQQRLNQGLSPNAATLDMLDVSAPKAPATVTPEFNLVTKREGKRDYDLFLSCSVVTEDVDDTGTYCDKYVFRARPRDATTHTPIANDKGGGWVHRTVRAPKDGEADETPRAKFENIPHPGKWEWQYQAKAIDALGQQSAWTTESIQAPATLAPPNPVSASIDVDRRRITVSHAIPNDPDDATERHQDFHHAIIEVNDADVWTNPLRKDRKVKGETITFRFPKTTTGGTYYARVTYVDAHGNLSTPLVVSGTRGTPPLPTIGSAVFDALGTRHARFRARVPVSVNDAGHDDFVRKIRVQLSHKVANAQPTASDRKINYVVRPDSDDPDEAVFRNIPKKHYVFVRGMSIDEDEKVSGWTTPWVAMGRPIDAGLTDAPATPTGLTVTVPTPRRLVADWAEPDDDDTTQWRVIIRRGVTQMADVRTRDTRYVYRVPTGDVGVQHSAQVYAINDLGVQSTPTSEVVGTPTADTSGLPDPPGTPSDPSVDFDAQGTTHAKYRAFVTAGTSSTGGTVDRYVLQLAHSLTSGASPPAGTKRQHGAVEGGATGDDLTEVFRNIPKKHYVWVRERAVNAGGKSAYTGWISAGRPIDDTGAVETPASLTNTSTIVSTRRAGAKWTVPLVNNMPDDSVATVHVQVSRNAGFSDIVDEAYKAPGKGSHRYAIPKADQGLRHYVRMRPINDTGAVGNWQPSTTGYEVVPETESAQTSTPGGGTITNIDQFSAGLRPIRIVTALPPLPNAEYKLGDLVLLTTDWKLYRLTLNGWTAAVDGADIMQGTIGAAQIVAGSITGDRIAAGTIEAGRLAATLVMSQYIKLANPGAIVTGDSGSYIIISASVTEKDRITFYSGAGSAALQAADKNIVLTAGQLKFGGSGLLSGGNAGGIFLANLASAPAAPSSGVYVYARAGRLRSMSPDGVERTLIDT